jgi:hypothetical protein
MNPFRPAPALLCFVCGCGAAAHAGDFGRVPSLRLEGTGNETTDALGLVESAPLTVFVFFSPECHCLAQHEGRLRALHERYRARGVRFVMVDSEVRGSPARDHEEAERRAYPFPILYDRHARLADSLGAEYATYSVVVDRTGRVRYRGGIDSDKTHLHDSATPYLEDAIDDLLGGLAPRLAEGTTLGCALEKW